MAAPAKPPAATAKGTGTPICTASLPMTIDDRTMMAPTDRSMPAVRMMRVCAMAMMPMTVTCWSTSEML